MNTGVRHVPGTNESADFAIAVIVADMQASA